MIALALILATVTGNPPPASYTCSGSTTSFVIPFPYLATSNIVATVTTGGVTSTLALTTDYTVTPSIAPSVGTFKLTSASKCANGATLTISRAVPLTQPQSFRTGSYSGPIHEQAHDREEMQIQQNAATHAADKAAQMAKDTSQDAAIVGVSTSVAALNGSSQAVTSSSSVLAFGSTTPRTLTSRFSDVVNVRDYGATGDGSTDDTAAIQAAITAGGGKTIFFPVPGVSYKLTGTVTVSTAGTQLLGNASKIFMAFGSSTPVGGILFSVTASNVTIDGLWIDSTGSSATTTINHYAIRAVGSSGAHLSNVVVRRCQFTALPWMDAAAVLATHAVYLQYIDNATVENSRVDAPSGAAVFLSVVTGANVLNNFINNTGWYSIQLNDQVNGARISGNRITGTLPNTRVWGGSINLMSNSTTGGTCGTPGCAKIQNVEIDHNYISGVHSYTAAVHIESSSRISFHNNRLENISLTYGMTGYPGSPFYADGTPPDYVRVYVRPVSAGVNEGPNDHISITDNTMIANGVSNLAIYVDAQDNGSGTLPYSDTLSISRNQIISTSNTSYFSKAAIVHGQQGGWKNVSILNNQITGFPDAASPVDGLVGTFGLVGAPVTDVLIDGNTLDVVGGVSSTTTHLGIGIEAFTNRVQVTNNIVKNFWDGIRTFTNSSAIDLGHNIFSGSGSLDYLLGVGPTAGIGTVPRYGSLFNGPRGSNLAATTIVATAAAGEYRVCATARTTTVGTGTTATLNIIWTDEGGAKTHAVGTWSLAAVDATGQINACDFVHVNASTNIQVSTSGGTYGTSSYSISATAEKLN